MTKTAATKPAPATIPPMRPAPSPLADDTAVEALIAHEQFGYARANLGGNGVEGKFDPKDVQQRAKNALDNLNEAVPRYQSLIGDEDLSASVQKALDGVKALIKSPPKNEWDFGVAMSRIEGPTINAQYVLEGNFLRDVLKAV